MLTAADYLALPEREAHDLVTKAAFEYYGRDRWRAEYAREVHLKISTVSEWFRPGKRPPAVHYLNLSARAELRKHRDAADALRFLINGG